jgi:hypothetical protein
MVIKIRGDLLTGIRGFFCDKDENFLKAISNDVSPDDMIQHLENSKYDYASLYTGRVMVKGKEVVGYSGRRKFFYIIDDDRGVIVFDSVYKNENRFTKKQIDCYIKAAKILESEGCFPKIYGECEVDINCLIKRKYSKKNAGSFRMVKKARGIIVGRIYTPSYLLKTEGKQASFFRKAWKYKRKKILEWPGSKLKMMFGEDFYDRHPDFNKKYLRKFCKKMLAICRDNKKIFKTIQHQSKPNMKYGNVIYNIKDKKWYYVDLEGNI